MLGSWLPAVEKPALAAGGDEEVFDLPPLELPEKGNPKLDSRLNRKVSEAAAPRMRSFSLASEDADGPQEDTVRVIIESLPGEANSVRQAAGNVSNIESSFGNFVQVSIPVSRLEELADNPNVRLVRTPMEPLFDAVTSEGVALINADDWQGAGYDGTGVKIAILDGGFTGYAALLGTELPASVTTQSFYSGSDIEGSSVHGTACAEIVYDIAPNAEFYLVNFGTSVELGNAVDWLIAQGVDIISASWGYPIGGPGNGTGTICEIVDTARANGILWVNSIGNSAQMHWQGNYNDPGNTGVHEFVTGTDQHNNIIVTPGQSIKIGLRWNDTWGSSGNDYALGLYRYSGGWIELEISDNLQDGDDDPVEFISYTAAHDENYYIFIFKNGNPSIVNFHLKSYNHVIQHQSPTGSFGIPADASSSLSVGAVGYSTPTTLETFSSRGPTDDGRIKPDIVAPDGVSTATSNPFYGTSASAPHVAAAAVLVKDRYSSYTPAQIQSFLEGRAVDLGTAGKDNLYGSGRLDLSTSPPLTPLAVSTGAASSVSATTATLNGNLTSLGGYATANVSFEWGTSSDDYTQETTPTSMSSTGSFSANLSELSSNTTYYCRAKGFSATAVFGIEVSFITL
ncbi:S8 family serine peptidase [Chloroflexota bacterium]